MIHQFTSAAHANVPAGSPPCAPIPCGMRTERDLLKKEVYRVSETPYACLRVTLGDPTLHALYRQLEPDMRTWRFIGLAVFQILRCKGDRSPDRAGRKGAEAEVRSFRAAIGHARHCDCQIAPDTRDRPPTWSRPSWGTVVSGKECLGDRPRNSLLGLVGSAAIGERDTNPPS